MPITKTSSVYFFQLGQQNAVDNVPKLPITVAQCTKGSQVAICSMFYNFCYQLFRKQLYQTIQVVGGGGTVHPLPPIPQRNEKCLEIYWRFSFRSTNPLSMVESLSGLRYRQEYTGKWHESRYSKMHIRVLLCKSFEKNFLIKCLFLIKMFLSLQNPIKYGSHIQYVRESTNNKS